MSSLNEIIISSIKSALNDEAKVMILDPRNDGIHLEAHVVSDLFKEMSLVKRHKIVMNALKEHFASFLHALALKTFTEDEWKAKNRG